MIPLEWLDNMTAISTLKVLLAFFRKYEKEGALEFKYAMTDLFKDSGVAENSTRSGLKELLEKGYIVVAKQGQGRTPKTYRITLPKVDTSKLDPPKVNTPKVEGEEWQKACGTRKKRASAEKKEENTSIKELDLFSYNLYTKEINSLSVVNPNLYLTDELLGQLANRILREVFLPRCANGKKAAYWFPQQMKMLKDLLVEYRTEQVIAAIVYWTEINPTANGMVSVRWLMYKDKTGSKLMHALDHFKSEYLKAGGENNADELLDNALRKQEEERIAQEQEKEKVAQMSNDDFVKSMLSGLGSIKI